MHDSISIIQCDCAHPELKNSYNIALLIPLYLDQVYEIEYDKHESIISSTKFKSLNHIEFYEGALIAIDSLKKMGINAVMHVYDINEKKESAQLIIQKPEMKNMDLIIGPWFDSTFKIVADFAALHQINIISPTSFECSAFKDNPYVIKITPGVQAQIKNLVNYIEEYYSEANILYAYKSVAELPKDTGIQIGNIIKEIYNNDTIFNYSVIDFLENDFSDLSLNLIPEKLNIIISLISGEAFLSSYLTNLNRLRENYEIMIVGLSGWSKYDNLEMTHYANLNTHWFGSTFIDYTRPEIKSFVKEYRKRYEGEPEKDAFGGFDITYYFFSALYKYGKNFAPCLDNMNDNNLLQTKFKFVKANDNSGYENEYVNIYRVYKYKLINAIIYPYKDYPTPQ